LLTEGKMNKRNNFVLRKTKWFSALFLALILQWLGCKKEEGDLGLLVQPQEDQLNVLVSDTTTVIAYTVKEDSLRSDEFTTALLGSYVDPVFGYTKASIFSHIRMESQTVDFTSASGTVAETVVDSVYLYLDLNGYYGNLNEQAFQVYRITEDIFIDSSYYSNSSVTTDGIDLVEVGAGNIVPDPFNATVIDGQLVNPIIRLKLDNSLGNLFVGESGGGNLDDNDAFIEWFKGLCITVDNPGQAADEGALLYMDLLNPNSRVSMYYRYTYPGEEDTLKFDFNINTSSARFTRTEQDYSGTVIEAQLNDSTLGSESIYVQTMGGVKAKIDFPHLDQMPDSVVINKAELVLPYDYFTSDPYSPQDKLYLLRMDSTGQTFFTEDFSEGEILHGGVRDNANKEFRFNIAKYVNNVLTGLVPNNGLFLISTSSMITSNRVVINGSTSANKNKLKFILTYTEL